MQVPANAHCTTFLLRCCLSKHIEGCSRWFNTVHKVTRGNFYFSAASFVYDVYFFLLKTWLRISFIKIFFMVQCLENRSASDINNGILPSLFWTLFFFLLLSSFQSSFCNFSLFAFGSGLCRHRFNDCASVRVHHRLQRRYASGCVQLKTRF